MQNPEMNLGASCAGQQLALGDRLRLGHLNVSHIRMGGLETVGMVDADVVGAGYLPGEMNHSVLGGSDFATGLSGVFPAPVAPIANMGRWAEEVGDHTCHRLGVASGAGSGIFASATKPSSFKSSTAKPDAAKPRNFKASNFKPGNRRQRSCRHRA